MVMRPLAVGREGRPVGGRGLVEIDQAAIHQLHDRRGGGHDLGQGGEVEDGVHLHGQSAGLKGALAEGLAVHGLAAVAHQDDGPGDVPGGDLLPGHLVDVGEAPGVDLAGLGLRRRGRRRLNDDPRQRRRRRGAPGQTAQNKRRGENETSRERPDGRHLRHGLLL